jgi:hypothetical protein
MAALANLTQIELEGIAARRIDWRQVLAGSATVALSDALGISGGANQSGVSA